MEWILAKELIDYKVAINEMERMVNEIIKGERQETIWLLEHTEIYTAGTSTKDAHLKNIVGAPVVRTNRGGQLTFHGPPGPTCPHVKNPYPFTKCSPIKSKAFGQADGFSAFVKMSATWSSVEQCSR